MIFITLGSQKFQFNRLLIAVDRLVENGTITDKIFAQIGYSDYIPKHFQYKQFLDREEFAKMEAKSDVVITHGGTGAIIGAVKQGKKVIAVPRLAKYGEHVDDHQIQLLKEFEEMNIILTCDDPDDLGDVYQSIEKVQLQPYVSNQKTIIDDIDHYLNRDDKGNIRVLMVGNHPDVKGGITSVISQLLNHDWDADGVAMRFVPTYKGGNALKKIVCFAVAYLKIVKELLFHRPDIVHMHMSYKGSFHRKYLIHRLCRKKKIKDIVHLHGSEFKKWYDSTNQKTKNKIHRMLRECDGLVVLGEKWNHVIKQIEPKTNTIVVSNAVHIPGDKVSWNQDRIQILFLGVLIERKGVSDLLKAIDIIKKQGKIGNLHFVIAGSGECEQKLKKQCAALYLDSCVEFAGWTAGEKKEKMLRESQILVLPSYNEGLPVAILEAISYGLPVVATDVGDISSAVRDGENGFLIKPGDFNTLADKIMAVALDRETYEAMSERSRKIAEDDFSDKTYYETFSACYHALIRRD